MKQQFKMLCLLASLAMPIGLMAQTDAPAPSEVPTPKVEEIFTITEVRPEFPGGEKEMYQFIDANLKTPSTAMVLKGTVIVQCVVEIDGTLSKTKIMRSLGSGCDEEALRLVSIMPKWSPGKAQGLAVRCYQYVTVKFGQPNLKKEVSSDEVFVIVEKQAEFPGGEGAMYQFLSDNVTYPPKARKKGITGKVLVEFVVEKDGSISYVRAVRGIGGGCDEEAIRIIELMPKWTPGMQQGQPVRSRFTLPIKFSLANKKG